MSITSSLANVQFYTALDPYNWKVDNRPLTDLRNNANILAAEADQNIVSRNLLSRAVAELSTISSGLVSAAGRVTNIHPVTANPFCIHYSRLILMQYNQIGVIRSDSGTGHYPGVIGPLPIPSLPGTARTFLVEARITDHVAGEEFYVPGLSDLSTSNYIGGVELQLLEYPTDQDDLAKDDPLLLYPSGTSGWVPLQKIVTYDDSINLQNNINVTDVLFHQEGFLDATYLHTGSSVKAPGKVLFFGKDASINSTTDHTYMMHWDYPIPVPPDTGKVLVSTGTQPGSYTWQDYDPTPPPDPIIPDGVPAGAIMGFAMGDVPDGWLECDGSSVSRSTYAHLFAAIGETYGVGDGSTTFDLPDYRGMFLRGWDNTRGIDTGRVLGTTQAEEVGDHQHHMFTDVTVGGAVITTNQTATAVTVVGDDYSARIGGNSEVANVGLTGTSNGSETRPVNVSVMFCIKAAAATTATPLPTPVQPGFPLTDTEIEFIGPVAAWATWVIPTDIKYLELTIAGGGGGGGAGGIYSGTPDFEDGTGGGGGASGQFQKVLVWQIPTGSKIEYYLGDGGAGGIVNSSSQSGNGSTGQASSAKLLVPDPDNVGMFLVGLTFIVSGGGGGTGGYRGNSSSGGTLHGLGGTPSNTVISGGLTNLYDGSLGDRPYQEVTASDGGPGSATASHGVLIVDQRFGADGFRSMISKPHPTDTSRFSSTFPYGAGANTDTVGADGEYGSGGGGGYGGTSTTPGRNGGKGGPGVLRIRH